MEVVTEPGRKPTLKVTMFDFERYYTIQAAEEQWPGIVAHQRGKDEAVYSVSAISNYDHHTPNSQYGHRGIQTAAMIALLQQAGLPPGDD